MRKYNNRTKKTMIILAVLFIGIIIIFSLFLKKSFDVEKTAYKISSGSIMFDEEYNMLTTNTEGILKVKWAGDYYLKYNNKDHNLGTHAVIYNTNNGDTTLYGKFYEVTKTGEVEVIKGQNNIKSSVNSRFFKLADRKYLIIDRTIQSSDSSFVTSSYLIVNLDKLGNATLLNDKTSYKTIKPTILRTSSYSFDIANEKLNFGGEDIDLKKIIGSTNEYDKDKYDLNANPNKEDASGTGSGDGTGSGSGSGAGGETGGGNSEGGTGSSGSSSVTGNGTGGNGTGSGNGAETGNNTTTNGNGTTAGSTSGVNNNYDSGVSDETVQTIINATKNTSVIRVTPDINSISIDYVVYDPLNEYKSVYVEVDNLQDNSNQINTIYLSKTDTNIKINDLAPNARYNLIFRYTYLDENKNIRENDFDDVIVETRMPQMVLTATRITNNKIYYQINLDKNYTITGGTINLLVNGQLAADENNLPISGNIPSGSLNTIKGEDCYIDLSNIKNIDISTNDILSLRLITLGFNGYYIYPNITYNFKY